MQETEHPRAKLKTRGSATTDFSNIYGGLSLFVESKDGVTREMCRTSSLGHWRVENDPSRCLLMEPEVDYNGSLNTGAGFSWCYNCTAQFLLSLSLPSAAQSENLSATAGRLRGAVKSGVPPSCEDDITSAFVWDNAPVMLRCWKHGVPPPPSNGLTSDDGPWSPNILLSMCTANAVATRIGGRSSSDTLQHDPIPERPGNPREEGAFGVEDLSHESTVPYNQSNWKMSMEARGGESYQIFDLLPENQVTQEARLFGSFVACCSANYVHQHCFLRILQIGKVLSYGGLTAKLSTLFFFQPVVFRVGPCVVLESTLSVRGTVLSLFPFRSGNWFLGCLSNDLLRRFGTRTLPQVTVLTVHLPGCHASGLQIADSASKGCQLLFRLSEFVAKTPELTVVAAVAKMSSKGFQTWSNWQFAFCFVQRVMFRDNLAQALLITKRVQL